jgi:Pentapeptide repeats (8 copies)
MGLTPADKIITGYKATDKNMKCHGHQFELGKWYSCEGELELCKNGFHFCEYPSGPWAYYNDIGTRIFKCEAKDVLMSAEPGADLKHVARSIRLVEELGIGGDLNTGYWNTGYRNTGDRNTGNRNTGNRNTGDWNTGDLNTGDWNTGNLNTGNRNTGDWNTGAWNTGDLNTGNLNTGNRNTGNRNTGDRNTGDGNVGDFHTGYFCKKPAVFLIFDAPAKRDAVDSNVAYNLCQTLLSDEPFDPKPFLSLPNATAKKIKAIHKAHIAARKKMRESK